jgi:hypothetical protein
MRLPNHKEDFWELRSAEESHRKNPDTFWLPPLEERQCLTRGQAAKLIFEIESVDDEGAIQVQGERIWVIVAERHGDYYIGILDGQPASIEPDEDSYLCFGTEIPFMPEHVIDAPLNSSVGFIVLLIEEIEMRAS